MLGALLVVGCAETAKPVLMASILTGPDIEEGAGDEDAVNETVGRVGMRAGLLKFGYQSHYVEGGDPDSSHGLFVSHDLVTDPNGLGLLGSPYVGAFGTFENDNIMYGPYIGTEHTVSGVTFNTEFHVRAFDRALEVLEAEDTDKLRIVFGPVFYFPLE
jgi:hypothetical protein